MIMSKRTHRTLEPKARYELPIYKVGDKGLEETGNVLNLDFVRGSKAKVTEKEYQEAVAYLDSLSTEEDGQKKVDVSKLNKDEQEKVEDCMFKVRNYLHPSQDGVIHESLLSMMIEDLTLKNMEYPSFETMQAITNLTQALHWLEERTYQRVRRQIDAIATK